MEKLSMWLNCMGGFSRIGIYRVNSWTLYQGEMLSPNSLYLGRTREPIILNHYLTSTIIIQEVHAKKQFYLIPMSFISCIFETCL